MDTASSTSSGTTGRSTRIGAHEAVVARSAAEHARLVVPGIVAALGAGDPVALAVDTEHRAALAAALDAADDGASTAVEWLTDIHHLPAFTVAQQLARFARRATTSGGRAMIVEQHVLGLPAAHWPRLEIALDVVTADLPVEVLCLYPADAPDLRLAGATHRWLRDSAGRHAGAAHVAPEQAVVEHPAPPPCDLGPPAAVLPFGAGELRALRRTLGELASAAGLDGDHVDDLALAVSELVSNSIEHGAGEGVLRLWQRPHGIVAEIVDLGGGMTGSFPGLRLPPPDGERGRGLWLAAELCDVLQVWAEARRTVVRVELAAHGRGVA